MPAPRRALGLKIKKRVTFAPLPMVAAPAPSPKQPIALPTAAILKKHAAKAIRLSMAALAAIHEMQALETEIREEIDHHKPQFEDEHQSLYDAAGCIMAYKKNAEWANGRLSPTEDGESAPAAPEAPDAP